MKKLGCYARVSTHDQHTLTPQRDAMAAYAQQRGWSIVAMVTEIGAGVRERRQREQLMRAARRRDIDAIVVWRLDRWGRSPADLVGTLQELHALGVGFISLSETLDFTTPAGRAMAGMLGIMLAVVVLTGVFQALHPLSHIETVDPATLHLSGEFVESNLGSAVEPDGVVTVRMIAHQYMLTPQCVTVPVGTLVRFRLTSPDVTHGFIIADTDANAMVVPGFVSEITTRFDRIGEYELVKPVSGGSVTNFRSRAIWSIIFLDPGGK